MKLKNQQAPFTIQIEPTEGCNLGCKFCGLQGMKKHGKKPWNFMDIKLAERIANEIKKAGWTSKIIFAMHGEPTLSPYLFEIISIFRNKLPDNLFYIITNGKGIADSDDIVGYIDLLKECGINHLLLDNYSPKGDWNKVIKAIQGIEEVIYLDKGIPMFSHKKSFDILVMPPIVDVKISFVRNLKNHCGAAFPPATGYDNKICAVPFRELSFRWDGSVSICCDDFRGQYPIANIKDMDIISLWNHERFQAARIMLYNKSRKFFPCSICNSVSMRVGLLPDKMGKESLPKITPEVLKIATNVSKENKPFSKIIKREWEK